MYSWAGFEATRGGGPEAILGRLKLRFAAQVQCFRRVAKEHKLAGEHFRRMLERRFASQAIVFDMSGQFREK